MQRAKLLTTLLFTVSCGSALAATPVFQLDAQQGRAASVQAIDAYPSGRISSLQAIPTSAASLPAGQVSAASMVFSEAGISNDVRPSGNVIPAAYSPDIDSRRWPGAVVSRLEIADDSLFYFLRNFKARPLQKPARWSMLLVGLCFLLYQVRRRPMRTSIGFPPATTPTSPGVA
ncbi:MAG: hypothetical protein ABI171_11835 [Collimonas sp.]|uniref:hypothetical protein n=1 Tax=Collimonas sp. TaxID=1963772 RepID=UPI003265744A